MIPTETLDALQKQIRRLTIAVWVGAIGVVLLAAALWFTSYLSTSSLEHLTRSPVADPKETSPCHIEAFYNQAEALMQAAKYKDVIALSDERMKTCPGDHYAWWFKAKALAIEERWDEALEALRRTELLRPDWRKPYVIPLRESIEWNKERKGK